ncbi:MAG: hypothetical protein ACK5TM_03035, partial [Methylobacterium sp.]
MSFGHFKARHEARSGDRRHAPAINLKREDHREDTDGHREIDGHEDHDAFHAGNRARREADQRLAHVADGGIGHQ